jgi:hypothetical protein
MAATVELRLIFYYYLELKICIIISCVLFAYLCLLVSSSVTAYCIICLWTVE